MHLNVEWRDLSPAAWQAQVRTAQGRIVPAGETAWMRSREVWIHAVDLNNGGSFADFPPDLLDGSADRHHRSLAPARHRAAAQARPH